MQLSVGNLNDGKIYSYLQMAQYRPQDATNINNELFGRNKI